jgi:predicted amidohydrolase YtcJ
MAPDLTAEAVIVEGNTITYVGSEAGALEALPPGAQEVDRAGFDMHIHVDADGSARTVLDAIERVQRYRQLHATVGDERQRRLRTDLHRFARS